MAKKKTKAQLNREIDMALHKRNVTALRQARSDPGAHEPAIDALLERGYSLERAKKAVKSYTPKQRLPERYEIKETIDGDWMILIDGIQWGSKRDRSGAGTDTYPTYRTAYEAALQLADED